MFKSAIGGLFGAMLFCNVAAAQICSPVTYAFTSGTTAVASQVNTDFQNVLTCSNTLLAPLANPSFTGKVGIGTTTPSVNLDVANGSAGYSWTPNGRDTLLVEGSGSSGTTIDIVGKSTGSSGIFLSNEITDALAQLTYTSSSQQLSLYNGTTQFVIQRYSSGTSPAITISSTSNVGIGTATPAQALEVDGEVKVDTFASASATSVCQNANVLSSCSSSIRYKENVRDANFGLNEIMKMRPVTFKWKGRDEHDLGFIAEEMEKVDPLFVTYKDGQIEGVKYPQLTAVLAGAVKELKATNDSQAKTIADLQRQIGDLRQQVASIQQVTKQLSAENSRTQAAHSQSAAANRACGGNGTVCSRKAQHT